MRSWEGVEAFGCPWVEDEEVLLPLHLDVDVVILVVVHRGEAVSRPHEELGSGPMAELPRCPDRLQPRLVHMPVAVGAELAVNALAPGLLDRPPLVGVAQHKRGLQVVAAAGVLPCRAQKAREGHEVIPAGLPRGVFEGRHIAVGLLRHVVEVAVLAARRVKHIHSWPVSRVLPQVLEAPLRDGGHDVQVLHHDRPVPRDVGAQHLPETGGASAVHAGDLAPDEPRLVAAPRPARCCQRLASAAGVAAVGAHRRASAAGPRRLAAEQGALAPGRHRHQASHTW
mmetsp:Transcript_44385/g.132492  ORF Transcript_44385/g.132492 Transcript_44385/m.132492 type:complete len:283 (-) Transcript_44385:457-1305(-)